MKTMSSRVEEFHRRHGFPVDHPLTSEGRHFTECLSNASGALKVLETVFRANEDDQRCVRASLLVGELAEVLEALAACDKEQLAKELADAAYVTAGTCVAYGIPMEECFDRIADANDTKENVTLHGDRGKGENYVAPSVEDLLR